MAAGPDSVIPVRSAVAAAAAIGRHFRQALPVVVAVTVTASAGAAFAGTRVAQDWRTVARVSRPGHSVSLDGITSAGQVQAWAVGGTGSDSGGQPVVQRWLSGRWRPVTLPNSVLSGLGQSDGLATVSASRPGNLWAFNSDGGWLHWNGTTWASGQDIGPGGPDVVVSVLAMGKSAAWVFGADIVKREIPFAAIQTGATWRRTPVPGHSPVVAASAVSASDLWAVLGTGLEDPLGLASTGSLVRWRGSHWRTVTKFPAAMSNKWLGSVHAFSDSNVWVGGAVKNGHGGFTEAAAHWDGHVWSVTRLGAPATVAPFGLVSMAADGSGGLWAIGACLASSKCPHAPQDDWRLWHESHGKWGAPTQPKLGSGQNVLVALASAGHSTWAAGAVLTSPGHVNGLIALHGPTP